MGVQELLCEDESINLNLRCHAYISVAVVHSCRQALLSWWAGMLQGHEIQLGLKFEGILCYLKSRQFYSSTLD